MARIYMDERAGEHVTERIRERIREAADQATVVALVKRLLTMEAPPEAVGHYSWFVNAGRIGRVVLHGHMVRTFLSFNENSPGSTEYRIFDDRLIRG